jgi:hypothetical protein
MKQTTATAFLRISLIGALGLIAGLAQADVGGGSGWQRPMSISALQAAALGGAAVGVLWRAGRAFQARRDLGDTAVNLWLGGVAGAFVGALLAIGSAAL